MRWKSKSWKQFYHTQKMEETRGDLTTDKFSLMFTGSWLSRLCPHKSLQAWNANKRMRLGLPTPKRYLSFTNVNTLRLFGNWRSPFPIVYVYGRRLWTPKLYSFTNLNGLVWKWLYTHKLLKFTALFVWIAQIKSNQSITLFNHGVLFA